MYDGPPMRCPWRCHEIGGTWIAENPACPFHGASGSFKVHWTLMGAYEPA